MAYIVTPLLPVTMVSDLLHLTNANIPTINRILSLHFSLSRLCSSPIYMKPSKSAGTSRVVRGRGEVKEKFSCSLSADKQHCLDSSLNRAIRAARHMKHASRRMAHSLSTGLEYQELLTQSCYY